MRIAARQAPRTDIEGTFPFMAPEVLAVDQDLHVQPHNGAHGFNADALQREAGLVMSCSGAISSQLIWD